MKPSATARSEQLPAHQLLCRYALCLLFLLFCHSGFAQGFTLSVTATDETCNGNGTLTFSIQGADPGAPITYRVYLLPDATNAIEQTSATIVQGLEDGEYLVTATQTVNGSTVVASASAVIEDATVPITINVTSTNSTCGNDGSMTITVTGGTASQYEILSGPVVRPLQPGGSFVNLPSGVYQVRAIDACGDATVVTHTLFTNGPDLVLGEQNIPFPVLPACDQITVQHSLTSINGVGIPYPLAVQITIFPPGGGAPLILNQNIPSGDPDSQDIALTIPFYYDVDYAYDLQITHPCGVILQHVPVRQKLRVTGGFDDAGCGTKFLIVSPYNFMPPYSIAFTSFPAGFDAAALNPSHPGPFGNDKVEYGGEGIPVPFGEYSFTLTDACGRTAEGQVEVTEPEVEPQLVGSNNDCVTQLGRIQVEIPLYILDTATLTVAPAAYTANELPYNATLLIDDEDKLILEGMPAGTYYFTLTDECGNVWEDEQVVIPVFGSSSLSVNARADCTPGKASVRVASMNPPLTAITVTAAPQGFPYALPYNATAELTGTGELYMDNLPPGNYSFKADDTCASNLTANTILSAYNVSGNDMQMTPHCGSFDLSVTHTSTGAFVSLWLQKEISPGVWGHPETLIPYPEDTVPTDTNSVPVTSGATMYSIEWLGHFRILKRFQSFGNYNTGNTKNCFEVLQEFDYTGLLEIVQVKNLSCPGTTPAIEVVTNGVPPITFKITHKNTQPFVVENGTNSIFTGLEPAVYTFQIEDSCGRLRTQSFNVNSLPPLVSAYAAPDISLCDEGNDGTETFNLSQHNNIILGAQDPAVYTLTYHATQQDAEAGLNPLPHSYPSGTATVYARVEITVGSTTCHAISPFGLVLNAKPQIVMNDTYAFCENDDITITAPAGFTAYEWAYNATIQNSQAITTSQPGQHTLTVTDSKGCQSSKTINVIASPLPHIAQINISDWTESNNTIVVVTETSALQQYFQYSLDGINYQESPVFDHLASGPYTVYVRDIYNCGLDNGEVFLLTYPRFFTPNGDGVNERWRIKFSQMEPDMKIYIFDRYGKLITSFGASDTGWDGTYNGARLPATDYWFVVTRQDGRQMRGHFSMMR
jgi:gliding motility-associated-like protein